MSKKTTTYTEYTLSKKLLLKLADILNPSMYKGYLYLNDDMVKILGNTRQLTVQNYPNKTQDTFSEKDVCDMREWFKQVRKVEKLFLREIT